ncbi:MAG: acyltransferase [Chloroflexi bacterium]|nr:acyltransferase [Chloroflexota bacterium]
MEIKTNKPERRYDIDWLRVLAVLLLIPYHTARIFDIWELFYAKSQQASAALTYIFVGFVNPWHMPLFFLLAGASTWFALHFRSGGQYVKERFTRLIIPLIFGVLVIVSPQAYLGARTYGFFDGSFLKYYPQFFQIGPTGDPTGYMGGFTPGHLWFILFLFMISLMALPLFLYLRRETGQRLIARLANSLTRPGAFFILPAFFLIVAGGFPDVGGKNIVYDLVLFIYGYVLMTDERFGKALEKYKTFALILGLGLFGVVMGILASSTGLPVWLRMALGACYDGFVTWPLLIAILGFGRKYLNFGNRVLKHASQIAYPFYILHQTVIVVIGFYVLQWNIGILTQFTIIVVAATAATFLLCEVVKLTNVTRFLFGMKVRSKETSRQVDEEKHATRITSHISR